MRRALRLAGMFAAASACACNSASTSAIAPSPAGTKCSASASTPLSSFPPAGGSGSLVVSSARECTWTVTSDTAWIVLDRTSGQGETTLSYRVAANGTPQPRRGALAVESARVEVSQEGAPCRFDLDTTRAEVAATGGALRIGLTTMTGCAWSAQALDAWITLTSGGAGGGSGVVHFAVAANSGAARQGAVTVANQTITVTQPGSTSNPPPPGGGSEVELDGRISALRGGCPNLTFVLSGSTVHASGATRYREGNCKHVEDGGRILVAGRRQSDGRVDADRIDLKPRN